MIANAEPWMEDARCREALGDFWFPDKGQGDVRTTRMAKAICRDCPVAAACLDYAMRTGEKEWGIYAGTTPMERRRLRRGAA